MSEPNITDIIMEQMQQMIPDGVEMLLPPPVFTEMNGQFVDFDAEAKRLVARFPVDERYFNPLAYVQGGILGALLDNTIGPLSYLVAPPSVTTQFNLSFLRPVTAETGHIRITAQLDERTRRQLFFTGTARDPQGKTLTIAHATAQIIDL